MNPDNTKIPSIREQFSGWLAGELGQAAFKQEQEQLEDILPGLSGYHILQYGYPAGADYLTASRIVHKTVLFLDDSDMTPGTRAIRARAEELPVATDSVDVIVLPHILEYSKDAHKLLREMDRALIGDGHVIIIGINPFSLWGLWHLLLCWWGDMPWGGRLISAPRLKDWLSLLDFEVKKSAACFFSPPLKSGQWLQRFIPLERLGRYCWPFFGGLYTVVARKRTIPLNPIKLPWQPRRVVIGAGAIVPTTRDRCPEK